MKATLIQLGITGAPLDFVLKIWEIIQTWDDIVDGEAVSEEDVTKAFLTLMELPSNPFYYQNLVYLQSSLVSMVIKWTAANQYESDKVHLDKAYMLRAGFYDVLAQVMYLVHGKEKMHEYARLVYDCYSETLTDIMQENKDA